jgi:hypothetical protein
MILITLYPDAHNQLELLKVETFKFELNSSYSPIKVCHPDIDYIMLILLDLANFLQQPVNQTSIQQQIVVTQIFTVMTWGPTCT